MHHSASKEALNPSEQARAVTPRPTQETQGNKRQSQDHDAAWGALPLAPGPFQPRELHWS